MVAKRRLKRLQAVTTKKVDRETEWQGLEWLNEPGRMEYVIDVLDRSREVALRMAEQYADLVEKYPDRWVAMTESEEPIVAGSSEELIAKIDEQGIDRNVAVIKFMRVRPRRRIL